MQNEVLGFRFVVFGTSAGRSVMLNLANKFSQCTFSIAEHYDLFSGRDAPDSNLYYPAGTG